MKQAKEKSNEEKTPRNPIFKERFRSLFRDGETHEEFGNRAGITRNTVTQYYNGNRVPDSIILRQICERCNVSADWLLGLSDVKMPDTNLQAVSNYTGLSEKAINEIVSISKIEQFSLLPRNPINIATLEALLTTQSGMKLLCSLHEYINKDFSNPYYFGETEKGIEPIPMPFRSILFKQPDGSYFFLGDQVYENYLLSCVSSCCETLKKEIKDVEKDGKS